MHERATRLSRADEFHASLPLLPAAWLYSAMIRVRNTLYERRWFPVHRADIPIISVGNLTAGGTGKTPHVIELAQRLLAHEERPAILTRGYRGTHHQPADEVLELRTILPTVDVIVDADRVRGAAEASTRQATCAILDDGFQHRRLHRDLDIVLIDALHPWGGGALLPAGRLREPLRALARANLVIITRTNQAARERTAEILRAIGDIAPHVAAITSEVRVQRVVDSNHHTIASEATERGKVLLAAGLGNVETVVRSAREFLGESRISEVLRFPDHHRYAVSDVASIIREAVRTGAAAVLTTRKDWVKLSPLWPAAGEAPRLFRMDVGVKIEDPEQKLDQLLARAMESRL